MIVVDTNVISELMRGRGAAGPVLGWLSGLPELPVTTVINRAEILSGIAILPAGQRKETLEHGAERIFNGLGVCLPLSFTAARQYATVVAECRAIGRPIAAMDALIAAICRDVGATLATRDVDDFAGAGVLLVDPWASGGTDQSGG